MRGDYLWDRSGPPDLEIVRLEQVLGSMAWRGQARKRRTWPAALAVAACLLIAVLLVSRAQPRFDSAWEVESAGGRTVFYSSDIGQVEAEQGTDLRVVNRGRLELRQGTIHALIWAPPRQFVVDTPAARAIDLGCQYTLTVDAEGSGFLRVEMGWVAFQHGRLESFIPEGAACRTRAARGPGIPFFEDATARFREALAEYEAAPAEPALAGVLEAARPRDALSLWHLLNRLPPDRRAPVFDRFAALVTLPAGVRREAVLAGDARAMDAAWNALGLDSAEWWREWKSAWRQ